MGAFVISYIVGSIVAIPFLAYHLLRTRRELNGLRAELVARGLIASGREGAHATLGAPRDGVRSLAGGVEGPRQLPTTRAAEDKPPHGAGLTER